MLLGAAVGIVTAAAVQTALGGVLGGVAPEVGAVLLALAFYGVVSFPKRALDSVCLAQSRESPSIAAMASIAFGVTRSRALTILSLRPAEREMSRAMVEVRRDILLGREVEASVLAAAEGLVSSSSRSALRKAAMLSADSIAEEDQEALGIATALALAEESKLPLFMAVSFFTPVLLLLFAAFSRLSDARSLAELVGFQLVVLDLAYYLTSSERRRLG